MLKPLHSPPSLRRGEYSQHTKLRTHRSADTAACMQALKWLQAASADQAQARLQAFDAKVQKLLEEDPPPAVATVPWELRRKVGVRIAQLNDSNVAHVMQILDHIQPRAIRAATRPDGDSVLDMNSLSVETLEKLQVSPSSIAVLSARPLAPPPPTRSPPFDAIHTPTCHVVGTIQWGGKRRKFCLSSGTGGVCRCG